MTFQTTTLMKLHGSHGPVSREIPPSNEVLLRRVWRRTPMQTCSRILILLSKTFSFSFFSLLGRVQSSSTSNTEDRRPRDDVKQVERGVKEAQSSDLSPQPRSSASIFPPWLWTADHFDGNHFVYVWRWRSGKWISTQAAQPGCSLKPEISWILEYFHLISAERSCACWHVDRWTLVTPSVLSLHISLIHPFKVTSNVTFKQLQMKILLNLCETSWFSSSRLTQNDGWIFDWWWSSCQDNRLLTEW